MGERSLLMANTMGGTESNAQEEQERREGRQPARDGGEGRGGQLVPSRLEPDHESGCPNRWILPPHFQVPVPSWERGLPCFGPALPGPPKGRKEEEEEEEGKKRKGKESALLSMLPYQLDIDNTTPSVIDIVLGPIYYTVPMHGVDIPM